MRLACALIGLGLGSGLLAGCLLVKLVSPTLGGLVMGMSLLGWYGALRLCLGGYLREE